MQRDAELQPRLVFISLLPGAARGSGLPSRWHMCSSFPTPTRGLFISAHALGALVAAYWLERDASGGATAS